MSAFPNLRSAAVRLASLVAALLALAAAPAAAAADDCAATCHAWEFVGASDNGNGTTTVRWTITNRCNRALSHASFELPVPVTAVSPTNAGLYYAPSGRTYDVENPTENPFRSIKFQTVGEGIRDGATDQFQFTVDAAFDPSEIIRVEAKSGTTQEILVVVPATCGEASGPQATPTTSATAEPSPTPTVVETVAPEATPTAVATATPSPVGTECVTPDMTPGQLPPTPTPVASASPAATQALPTATATVTATAVAEATASPNVNPATPTPNPLTPENTPAPQAGGSCGVAIAKSYSGLPQPGAIIEYRLVWSTTCPGTSTVTVVDPLPAEVEFVSVQSDAALATASAGEVHLQASMTAGAARTATIRARIRSNTAEGSVVCNEATVRDDANRSDAATACLRVSGADRLRLYTKAHTHIRPNRFLTVLTRYHRVSANNQMVMTLPEHATITRIFEPQPDRIDGRVLTWTNLPASAGKVKVTLQVDADAPMGTILPTEAVLTDAGGVEFYNTATLVIRESDPEMNGKAPQLSFAMPAKVIAGLSNSFKLRYRNVAEPVTLELALPEAITIESAVPPATTVEPGRVVWNLLPGGSGAVKIRARIAADAADGSELAVLATLGHARGTLQSEASARVRAVAAAGGASSTGSSSARALQLTVSGAKSVRAGLETTLAVQFRYLEGAGNLRLDLPAGVEVVQAVPAAAAVSGSRVEWHGLASISGSLKLTVRPLATLAAGTTLPVMATLDAANGATAVGDFAMVVR